MRLLTCILLPGVVLTGELIRTVSAQAPTSEPVRQPSRTELLAHFGEQQFRPPGQFLLRMSQVLPDLEWVSPELVGTVIKDHSIPTRWFNEQFEEVRTATKPGRYYVYGEAPTPTGPPLRRAMTCVCLPPDLDLRLLASHHQNQPIPPLPQNAQQSKIDRILEWWRSTEEGAVELAALLDSDPADEPARPGQHQMENATRHVQLKRKLMGLASQPLLIPKPRRIQSTPAPVLRRGSPVEADLSEADIRSVETLLDQWYAASKEPMAIVIARNGVIAVSRGYGTLNDDPVTVDTPMLLHSAMKPLLGVQLATYVDRGYINLDEPIGKHLPDFNSPADRLLTHRAGHVHVSGIHFPWELAFRRLFYFHTWHESLIAHCPREWAPGARHRYGVVGVILSVRALELLRGRNYWDAMERDVFEPLGIQNIYPGGTGFSAENMARIGVMLDNHGRYGPWELFSEETYQAILPTSLTPHFPSVSIEYGIGLQKKHSHLGPASYGHGGGCGTQLIIDPETHTVFAMVRNGRGRDFQKHLGKVISAVRNWPNRSISTN